MSVNGGLHEQHHGDGRRRLSGASQMRFFTGGWWSPWEPYSASTTASCPVATAPRRVGRVPHAARQHVHHLRHDHLGSPRPAAPCSSTAVPRATKKLTVTAKLGPDSAPPRCASRPTTAATGSTAPGLPDAGKATVTIAAPDGTKRVYAYYRDAAGHQVPTSDTIVLDTDAAQRHHAAQQGCRHDRAPPR